MQVQAPGRFTTECEDSENKPSLTSGGSFRARSWPCRSQPPTRPEERENVGPIFQPIREYGFSIMDTHMQQGPNELAQISKE